MTELLTHPTNWIVELPFADNSIDVTFSEDKTTELKNRLVFAFGLEWWGRWKGVRATIKREQEKDL